MRIREAVRTADTEVYASDEQAFAIQFARWRPDVHGPVLAQFLAAPLVRAPFLSYPSFICCCLCSSYDPLFCVSCEEGCVAWDRVLTAARRWVCMQGGEDEDDIRRDRSTANAQQCGLSWVRDTGAPLSPS